MGSILHDVKSGIFSFRNIFKGLSLLIKLIAEITHFFASNTVKFDIVYGKEITPITKGLLLTFAMERVTIHFNVSNMTLEC